MGHFSSARNIRVSPLPRPQSIMQFGNIDRIKDFLSLLSACGHIPSGMHHDCYKSQKRFLNGIAHRFIIY